jgi:metal-dependent amidase/aminoacylase/carboxypeptidase family protein
VSRQIDITENAAVVTVGSIHGGVRSNIIPEEVNMEGTIRALSPEDRQQILDKVRRVVINVAEKDKEKGEGGGGGKNSGGGEKRGG